MTVPYTPLAIANSFIQLGSRQGGVEHMKLQKLVYYAYGWWLASYGLEEKRLTNEGPEIWKHGPVFSSLYATLRTFGRTPVTIEQSADPFSDPDRVGRDNNVHRLVEWIWQRYGHLSSYALSSMTHRPGTSWYRTAMENNFSVPFSATISDTYIFEEFSALKNAEFLKRAGGGEKGEKEKITA